MLRTVPCRRSNVPCDDVLMIDGDRAPTSIEDVDRKTVVPAAAATTTATTIGIAASKRVSRCYRAEYCVPVGARALFEGCAVLLRAPRLCISGASAAANGAL